MKFATDIEALRVSSNQIKSYISELNSVHDSLGHSLKELQQTNYPRMENVTSAKANLELRISELMHYQRKLDFWADSLEAVMRIEYIPGFIPDLPEDPFLKPSTIFPILPIWMPEIISPWNKPSHPILPILPLFPNHLLSPLDFMSNALQMGFIWAKAPNTIAVYTTHQEPSLFDQFGTLLKDGFNSALNIVSQIARRLAEGFNFAITPVLNELKLVINWLRDFLQKIWGPPITNHSTNTTNPKITPPTKIGQVGLELIKFFEGEKLKPYDDGAGNLTIGYGHLIRPGEKFTTITKAQAEELLRQDVTKAENSIVNFAKEYNIILNQNQFDALVSFVFNLGPAYLNKNSTYYDKALADAIVGNDTQAVQARLKKYITAGGIVYDGLKKRREREAELYGKPVAVGQTTPTNPKPPATTTTPPVTATPSNPSVIPVDGGKYLNTTHFDQTAYNGKHKPVAEVGKVICAAGSLTIVLSHFLGDKVSLEDVADGLIDDPGNLLHVPGLPWSSVNGLQRGDALKMYLDKHPDKYPVKVEVPNPHMPFDSQWVSKKIDEGTLMVVQVSGHFTTITGYQKLPNGSYQYRVDDPNKGHWGKGHPYNAPLNNDWVSEKDFEKTFNGPNCNHYVTYISKL